MWTGERHHHADGREVALADLGLRLRQRILYECDFDDLREHDVCVEEPGVGASQ